MRFRALDRLLVSASLVVLGGCATYGPTIEEPLRVATVADLGPAVLGLQPGVTSLAEAKASYAARGLTGVVDDTHVVGARGTLSVLAADYQSSVRLFENDRYVGELKLPTRGLPPYGLAVRIGWERAAPEILVLYRDPLDRVEEPPTLLLFRKSAESQPSAFALAARTPLGEVAERHGGMSQPMLLGDSLAEGVLLVARDREGDLWDTGYFLREGAGAISLEPQPIADAMRCSCVARYAAGIL